MKQQNKSIIQIKGDKQQNYQIIMEVMGGVTISPNKPYKTVWLFKLHAYKY